MNAFGMKVRANSGKILLIAIGIAVLLAACVGLFVIPRWPFREGDLKKRIASAGHGSVQFGNFHQVFFPHPGCVVDQFTLTPSDPSRPKITAQQLTIYGLYTGLIGNEKHLSSLQVRGLQVVFPAHAKDKKSGDEPASGISLDGIRFDEIEASDSQVVFSATGQEAPRTFNIHQLILKNYAPGQALHFNSVLRIPDPPAEVQIAGDLGPLSGGELGDTSLSGSFTMKDADLGKYQALMGKLTAQGKFNGKLQALQVNGSTDTPKFGLTDTGHSIALQTQFSALVNGMNGDVNFDTVHALMGETKLDAQGQLASDQDGKGKTLTLNINSDEARIQDLMYLFVQSKAPLQGATRFQAKVQLPHDDRPFEQRVEMTARFGIRGSHFTAGETQQKVSELSESARGNPKDDDPPMIVTDLLGDVKLANGTATFSQLSMRIPGASAAMHGTYKLESHAVDLRGTLHTDVKLSQATTGFKAFLMKVVEAAKVKKKEGATVPVKVTGTYEKPDFGLDITSEK
jgi:hypothetical protein